MQTKWRALIISALVGTIALVGMTGCQPNRSPKNDHLVTIGSNLEMTGSNASFGTSTVNAMQMAIDEVNSADGILGKQIQLIALDNRSDVAGSSDAMFKLLDAGVVGIIGPDTSSNVIAVAPMVAEHKIPLVSPKATHPAVTIDPATGKVREYVFRATFIDSYQGRIAAEFAYGDLGARKAAILVDNASEYAIGLANFFTKSFTAAGGAVIAKEAYLQKDVDFKVTLTKLKAQHPDVLFVPGYYQEVGMIVRQAREIGWNVPIVGGDGWDSDKLVEIAGAKNLNNTYYTNHYSPNDTDPVLQQFITRYERRFGYKPDSYAVLGYDATRLLLEAIRRAQSTDPHKIQQELTQMQDFKAISGKISIDADHNTVSSGVVIQLVDGERRFLKRIQLSQ